MGPLSKSRLSSESSFQLGSRQPEQGFRALSGELVRTSAQIPRDTYLMLRNLDKNGRTKGFKSWLKGKNSRLRNGNYRVYTKKFDTVINGKDIEIGEKAKQQISHLESTLSSDPAKMEALQQRLKLQRNNLAVTILVDCSGSMAFEERSEAVVQTCITINRLMQSQSIPFEILGFNVIWGDSGNNFSELTELKQKNVQGRIGDLRHYVFKSFEQDIDDQAFSSIFQAIENGHGNIDGEAVAWAHSRLRKRKEKIRYLLVLTDGNPAGEKEGEGSSWSAHNNPGYISAHLQNLIKQLDRQEIILFGVGIGTDVDISRFYKNYISIPSGESLGKEVLSVIELIC